MTIVRPVHVETAPLPAPLLGFATRADDLGYTILFGAAVAEPDRDLMTWSMIEEMRRTGKDEVCRVSVE